MDEKSIIFAVKKMTVLYHFVLLTVFEIAAILVVSRPLYFIFMFDREIQKKKDLRITSSNDSAANHEHAFPKIPRKPLPVTVRVSAL